ncbi:MAG: hypothetical protein ACPG4T_05160 [Nannocystaceae bacterium]
MTAYFPYTREPALGSALLAMRACGVDAASTRLCCSTLLVYVHFVLLYGNQRCASDS